MTGKLHASLIATSLETIQNGPLGNALHSCSIGGGGGSNSINVCSPPDFGKMFTKSTKIIFAL